MRQETPIFTINVYSEKVKSGKKSLTGPMVEEYTELILECANPSGSRKCDVRGRKRSYRVSVNVDGGYKEFRGVLESCLALACREVLGPKVQP